MVTYGDREFREWADDAGLNDDDLKIARKTMGKRAFLWFIMYVVSYTVGIALTIAMEGNFVYMLAGAAVAAAFLPLFNSCLLWRKYIKKGSLDAKPGPLLWFLLFAQFLNYVCILPLITQAFVKKGYGTGLKGLLEKGIIGGHE